MALVHVILNKFTGGQVSPEVWGRTETNQWPAMLEIMENCYPDPRGGAKRRPGLHYVAPTKFPQQNSRLIPFVFSREQSYMMEFGDYYIRFFKDNGYVEDIGSVVSYLGDGTSTRFVYPYPAVDIADIEIYDETGTVVPDTEYTIDPINLTENYAPSFDTWNLDYGHGTSDPWTLVGTAATSSATASTILGIGDLQVPIGGAYKATVDITDVQYLTDTVGNTDATDNPLNPDGPAVSIISATAIDDIEQTLLMSYSFQAQDIAHTSDFYWELRRNNDVLDSGSSLNVSSALISVGGIPVVNIYAGDVFSVYVQAIGDHPNSEPQISGTVSTTTLNTTYVVNNQAKLESDFVPNAATIDWNLYDPTIGETVLFDFDEVNYQPAPMEWLFRVETGLQVTLDNLTFNVKTPGYIVTFTTAPAIGTVRTIKDGTVTMATLMSGFDDSTAISPMSSHSTNAMPFFHNIVRRPELNAPVQPGDIFEIQSPFSEAELEDLYYAQANDVMIFAIDGQKPWTLTRYNPYDWRFEQPEMTGAPWEAVDYNPLEGYPRTVCWFQERLWFGGTVARPQTLWGSRTADFYDFQLPDKDGVDYVYAPDDSVEYTIAAYTHEAIEWLSSERVLVIGTSSTEHRLSPDQYIATNSLPLVSRMSAYGGAHVMPAYMGNLTVFVQTAGNQVRTFEQSTQSVIEKWDSYELDWMASDLTEPKVKQMGYALNPDSLLFMTTLEGDFLTMTYEPGMDEEDMSGWAKQTTDGNFKSSAAMQEDTDDQIWAIVDREIEGVNYRYVEYFDPDIYTDATLTYPPDGGGLYPPLQSVGGLDHLEGKTVTIKVDGSTHPDLQVINGQVELNNVYENIEIGLKYLPILKLQRFAMASQPANLQGFEGRWVKLYLRLVKSCIPLVDGKRAAERSPNMPMNEVEAVVTADVKFYNRGFDTNKQLTITQDLPLPLHLTAIFGTMEVE